MGIHIDTVCSQAGKMNDGTQAPASITISSVARMANPRVASGVRPNAATMSPKLEVSSANATSTAMKPDTLPLMRTPGSLTRSSVGPTSIKACLSARDQKPRLSGRPCLRVQPRLKGVDAPINVFCMDGLTPLLGGAPVADCVGPFAGILPLMRAMSTCSTERSLWTD